MAQSIGMADLLRLIEADARLVDRPEALCVVRRRDVGAASTEDSGRPTTA